MASEPIMPAKKAMIAANRAARLLMRLPLDVATNSLPKLAWSAKSTGGDCEKPARDMQGAREVGAGLCKVDVKMRESFFHTTNTTAAIDCRFRRNRGLARRESIACELFLILNLGALVVCRALLQERVPLSPSSRSASPWTSQAPNFRPVNVGGLYADRSTERNLAG